MKISSPIVFLIISLPFLFHCSPIPGPNKSLEQPLNVENERIFLAPVSFKESLEKLNGWPEDSLKQKILKANFKNIRDKLDSEFHRCEKFGLYRMVEENESPTIIITVTITSIDLENDTLRMPLKLQAQWLIGAKSYAQSIPAKASVENASREKNENRFHYLGLLLSNYTINFPYKLIVSFFYPRR